jgi:hypothetical protein
MINLAIAPTIAPKMIIKSMFIRSLLVVECGLAPASQV